mgnify:CR=1 FL=1|jgi:hypothetical protein
MKNWRKENDFDIFNMFCLQFGNDVIIFNKSIGGNKMIWIFTCPICKKSKSHGRVYKINSKNRWICVDCIHKLMKENGR